MLLANFWPVYTRLVYFTQEMSLTPHFSQKSSFEISSMVLFHWVSRSSILNHNYSSIYLSQWNFFMMFFFLPIFSYFCASVQSGVGKIWNIKYKRNTCTLTHTCFYIFYGCPSNVWKLTSSAPLLTRQWLKITVSLFIYSSVTICHLGKINARKQAI